MVFTQLSTETTRTDLLSFLSLCFIGNRCSLVLNQISLNLDSSLCCVGTGYGVISPTMSCQYKSEIE